MSEPPRNETLASGPLLPQLLASHAVPLVLVACALMLLLVAIGKVSVVLNTLRETELDTLRDEEALHRTMWNLDVAIRHARDGCQDGHIDANAREQIAQRGTALRLTMKTVPGEAAMLPLAEQYLALAHDIEAGLSCEVLDRAIDTRRDQLDENLTNLWVNRLGVLHDAVSAKEEEAQRIGNTAMWLGVTFTLASILLASLVARRMARSLSHPLIVLAETARRVGVDDVAVPIAVHGPLEIRVLADELEKMRQRLAQLDALKQGFLASVSHELRTPLSKIREALALLADGVVGSLDARQSHVLGIARQACEREIRMVSTLLDLSRLRSGNPLRPRDGISIGGIVSRAVDDELPEATHRSVQLRVQAAPDIPLCRLDPVLLERAVANLIRNAVSVSRAGQQVRVKLSVLGPTPDRSASCIQVSVSDDGPGVPTEIRDIVFDAFVTHSVPQGGKALGVGLGLALAREIARAHGGDLLLDPHVTAGATFHLWLPLPTHAPFITRVGDAA